VTQNSTFTQNADSQLCFLLIQVLIIQKIAQNDCTLKTNAKNCTALECFIVNCRPLGINSFAISNNLITWSCIIILTNMKNTYQEHIQSGAPGKVTEIAQSLLPDELQHCEHIHRAMRCHYTLTMKFNTPSRINNSNIEE